MSVKSEATVDARAGSLPMQRHSPNRRAAMAALAAALGSAVSSDNAWAIPVNPAGTTAAPAEGFFISWNKTDSASSTHRLFFIESEWLSYFEITDQYDSTNIDHAVGKVEAGSHSWRVLYSDNLDQTARKPLPNYLKLPPPIGGTYLAMSIASS